MNLSKRGQIEILHEVGAGLLIPDINYKGKSMPQIKGIAFYIN
jgi:hypothetical protein